MKRIVSLLVVALALVAAWPGLASAHAALVSSTPAAGSVVALTNAPTNVTITFSEDVAKDVTTITVTGADGTTVSTGATAINFDNPKLASVNLKQLSPGPYTVKWHAVTSDDNGQTDGTFTFTILNNTSGLTNSGSSNGTTTGGTTTSGTSAGTTTGGTSKSNSTGTTTSSLPQTGTPFAGLASLLGLGGALLLVGLGLVLRRARLAR